MNINLSPNNCISISSLNQLLNEALENCFPSINFIGEISELKVSANGHAYLTLKDQTSSISIVIWRTTYSKIDFNLKIGQRVFCVGKPNIYTRTGRLQIVVNEIYEDGLGELQKRFLLLKNQLEKSGYFNQDRKRQIPSFPRTIGIITSANGAALQDMLVRIRARMPSVKVVLADVSVQGLGSVAEIILALENLNQIEEIDFIIIARGGGALEDLWGFNDELLVKAIFASSKPVVSAVGHETDVTLSDLVADLRAPTPTAAIELTIPDRQELFKTLNQIERLLGNFEAKLKVLDQTLDDISSNFAEKFCKLLENYNIMLSDQRKMLINCEPYKFAVNSNKLVNFKHLLSAIFDHQQQTRNLNLKNLTARYHSLSPKQTLKRGYLIASKDNKIINSKQDLKLQDKFELKFHDGYIISEVIDEKN